MNFETTMTGSFYRSKKVIDLLNASPTGELGRQYQAVAVDAEREAVVDQLHPDGYVHGLNWVSNGEQRKAGYTTYLPNRFAGFSRTERTTQKFGNNFIAELIEASPGIASAIGNSPAFRLPAIEAPLQYTGEKLARSEAEDAAKIAKQEKAERIFIPSPSPGVITVFYPPGKGYRSHQEYLDAVSKEMRKEYSAILSVNNVDLQIDAPDLAMAASLGVDWGIDFFDALPLHVEAINRAISGLPRDRIRVHYCYGNYVASHLSDPSYERVLPEILGLKVGTIVGEMANGRHQGDPLILKKYVREHGWPAGMKYAVGVVDVKSPFVETPETIAQRLTNVSSIDEIGPEKVLGGTDCGFETFENMGSIPKSIALKKLKSLVQGAELARKIS
ncbi:methionine synthase [Thermoplasmatales archaeon]|nr:methionine synthase [Thermoplasmatales archaeon]